MTALTHEQALAIDPDRIPLWINGHRRTIDDINAIERAHAKPAAQVAAEQQRSSDISVLKGLSEHLAMLKAHHSHNKMAIRITEKRLADAAQFCGGLEAAKAAGYLPGALDVLS